MDVGEGEEEACDSITSSVPDLKGRTRLQTTFSTKPALSFFCRWRTRSSLSTFSPRPAMNIFRLLGPCTPSDPANLLTSPDRGFGPPGLHIHPRAQGTDNQIVPWYVSPLVRARRQADIAYPGISFKTQALYVLVFLTRYIDLFFRWISLYNFVMKIFFIISSCYILYLMKFRFRLVMHTFLSDTR